MSALLCMLVVLAYTVGRVVGLGRAHEQRMGPWVARLREQAMASAFRRAGPRPLRVIEGDRP
jgi:hypothetical protein